MPAYLVARVEVRDWDEYQKYTRHTPRVIAQHGGRFLVRGAPTITLEGAEDPRRLVVIEFPSLERARAFYQSPEYQKIRRHRDAASEAHFLIVEGFPQEEWDAAVRESSKLSTHD